METGKTKCTAQPEDVVLILDKEINKGKFTLGIIDSVKTDEDNFVRKVTVKYKLPSKGNTLDYEPQPFKYAERNVRGLALVVTAEERKQTEAIDIDDFKTNADEEDIQNDEEQNSSLVVKDAQEPEKDAPENDVQVETASAPKKNALPPTSSGRKRFKPNILDL